MTSHGRVLRRSRGGAPIASGARSIGVVPASSGLDPEAGASRGDRSDAARLVMAAIREIKSALAPARAAASKASGSRPLDAALDRIAAIALGSMSRLGRGLATSPRGSEDRVGLSSIGSRVAPLASGFGSNECGSSGLAALAAAPAALVVGDEGADAVLEWGSVSVLAPRFRGDLPRPFAFVSPTAANG